MRFLTLRGPITRGHLSTFSTMAFKLLAIISLSVQGTLRKTSQIFVEFLLSLFGVSHFWSLEMVVILSLSGVGSCSSCWVMEFPTAKPSLDSLHSVSPATPKRACSHDLPCCLMTAIESHLALLYQCYNSLVITVFTPNIWIQNVITPNIGISNVIIRYTEFQMSSLQTTEFRIWTFEYRVLSLRTFDSVIIEYRLGTLR